MTVSSFGTHPPTILLPSPRTTIDGESSTAALTSETFFGKITLFAFPNL